VEGSAAESSEPSRPRLFLRQDLMATHVPAMVATADTLPTIMPTSSAVLRPSSNTPSQHRA
jgi:hypothetical protein